MTRRYTLASLLRGLRRDRVGWLDDAGFRALDATRLLLLRRVGRGYAASVPALGVYTQGRSRREAIAMVSEAIIVRAVGTGSVMTDD
jgi:hypothetical protein